MGYHLSALDILRIIKNEKIESEKERHFFRCEVCQKRFRTLKLLEEYNISIQDNDIEIAIIFHSFEDFEIIKGNYIVGSNVRGSPKKISASKMKEYTHAIKGKDVIAHFIKVHEKIIIDILEGTVSMIKIFAKGEEKSFSNCENLCFKLFPETLVVISR